MQEHLKELPRATSLTGCEATGDTQEESESGSLAQDLWGRGIVAPGRTQWLWWTSHTVGRMCVWKDIKERFHLRL